jgi:hypothetical protein
MIPLCEQHDPPRKYKPQASRVTSRTFAGPFLAKRSKQASSSTAEGSGAVARLSNAVERGLLGVRVDLGPVPAACSGCCG